MILCLEKQWKQSQEELNKNAIKHAKKNSMNKK